MLVMSDKLNLSKVKPFEAINWNQINDYVDKLTWEKLVSQFWVDTRIPVSNDLDHWNSLKPHEHELYNKVFGGLTILDTLQSEGGVGSMSTSRLTQHEEAVINNIAFMESIHAKSYSTIFSTLNTPMEIERIFEWTRTDKNLQYKVQRINQIYKEGTDLQKRAGSVLLESFLFYSGFYTPLKYLGMGKMANVAEIIKLIIRDESVHGTYFGYKFRVGFNKLDTKEQEELQDWVYETLLDLYANEVEYTKILYTATEWTPLVIAFLEYNANKALDNLGFPPVFTTTASDVDPVVMNGLSTATSNHDFFSQVGNGYLLGNVEPLTDDDYLMIYEQAK